MGKVELELPETVIQRARQWAQYRGHNLEDVLREWINYGAAQALELYTIGHSGLSNEAFLALLAQHGITVLVDVRSVPYSRNLPHFNKHELSTFLESNGVAYRFAGDYLGGRPAHADVYKSNELPDQDTKRQEFLQLVQYEEVMKRDWYQKGIARLIDILKEQMLKGGKTAIMCSEGNPLECHRHHLIARSLVDSQVKILHNLDIMIHHILKNGELTTVDETMFDADSITQPRLFE
jgi:uncharacterized protein (DUF488 family)